MHENEVSELAAKIYQVVESNGLIARQLSITIHVSKNELVTLQKLGAKKKSDERIDFSFNHDGIVQNVTFVASRLME